MASAPTPEEPRADAAPEEWASGDDRAIGRAVRWSLLILLVVGGIAAAVLFWLKRTPAPPPPKVTKLVAPVAPVRAETQVPQVRFTNITQSAGITFVHNNGGYGDKLLPETMGGGVAFFDCDNDSDQDLLFVNSTYWPGRAPAGAKPVSLALYRNDGTGKFADATAGSGLEIDFYGMGVACGDYDNDGNVDVFVTGVG